MVWRDECSCCGYTDLSQGQSKFAPSPQEVALVNQIFTTADPQRLGVLNGEAAVKVFSGTKLPPTVLAEVWNLADEDQKGSLTRKDVAVAIRLLGHAQRGERISEAYIHQRRFCSSPRVHARWHASLEGLLVDDWTVLSGANSFN